MVAHPLTLGIIVNIASIGNISDRRPGRDPSAAGHRCIRTHTRLREHPEARRYHAPNDRLSELRRPSPHPLPASGARESIKAPRPAPAGRWRGPRQWEGEGQTRVPDARASVLQRRPDRTGIVFDHSQINPGDVFGRTPPLFPVLKGPQVEHELSCKLGLAQAEARAQSSQRSRPKAAGQSFIGQRLRVWVVTRRPLDFLIGHPLQPVPIGPALRFGIAPGSIAYKLLFHDGSPFWR
jgi:hypothetical protein